MSAREAPSPPPPETGPQRRLWRYGRALIAPVLIWVLLVAALIGPLRTWLRGEDSYDRDALQEWLEEARNADQTLSDLIEEYLRRVRECAGLKESADAEVGVDGFGGE